MEVKKKLETKSKKFGCYKKAKSFEELMKKTGQFKEFIDNSKIENCSYNYKVVYYRNTKKNRNAIGFHDPFFDDCPIGGYPESFFR